MTDAEKSSRDSFNDYIEIHKRVSKRIQDIIARHDGNDKDDRKAMSKELFAYSKTMAGMMGGFVLDAIAPETNVAHMLPLYAIMLKTMRETCEATMDDFIADHTGGPKENIDDVLDHFWDGLDLEEVRNAEAD